ncbi:MAG: hypothetical protein ACT4OX_12555 [Actinomycetota bacterium]
MRTWHKLGPIGVLALSTSGCWTQSGYDAGRTSFNPAETTLTAAAISARGFSPSWSQGGLPSVRPPIFVAGRVIVVSTNRVSAFNATTGALLW